MVEFCSPSVLPTYTNIHDMMKPLYSIADRLVLPSQPSTPEPIWTNINSPQQELEITITEMIQSQLTSTITAPLVLLTDILEIELEDILPFIPGFEGYTLINIIEGDLQELLDLASEPGFDFSLITLLPSPVYPNFNVPNWQALVAVQVSINEYYQILTGTLQDLVNEVAGDDDALDPPLPAYPTLDQIYALLPSVPTLEDLLAITIPDWNYQLVMPIPLVPNQNVSQYDFVQGLKNMYSGLSTTAMAIIIEFIEDTLELDLDIPIFCLEITVI